MAKSKETLKSEISFNSSKYLENLDKLIAQNERAENLYKGLQKVETFFSNLAEFSDTHINYYNDIKPKLMEIGKVTILSIDEFRKAIVIPRFEQFKALKKEADVLLSSVSITSEELTDLNGIAAVIHDFMQNSEDDMITVTVIVNRFNSAIEDAARFKIQQGVKEAGKKTIDKLNDYREEIDEWRKHPLDKAMLEGFKSNPFAISTGLLLAGGAIFLLFFTKGGRQLLGIGGKVALKAM